MPESAKGDRAPRNLRGGWPADLKIDRSASASHSNADAGGQGIVTGQRFYQLIRQSKNIADHTFEIQFVDPGMTA
jgi:hypothetical protein